MLRDWADATRPYDVRSNTRASRYVSKRSACDRVGWVAECDTGTGEVAVAFHSRRHEGLDGSGLLSILEALVRAERKHLVLDYRSAAGRTILVLPLGRPNLLEKASCVELVVAEEFPG